jgi:hypothetical protein
LSGFVGKVCAKALAVLKVINPAMKLVASSLKVVFIGVSFCLSSDQDYGV